MVHLLGAGGGYGKNEKDEESGDDPKRFTHAFSSCGMVGMVMFITLFRNRAIPSMEGKIYRNLIPTG
jgi:hypothetical protein